MYTLWKGSIGLLDVYLINISLVCMVNMFKTYICNFQLVNLYMWYRGGSRGKERGERKKRKEGRKGTVEWKENILMFYRRKNLGVEEKERIIVSFSY